MNWEIDPSELAQFLKEYDAGLHPLSSEDEAALRKSEPEFRRRLREIIHGNQDEQSFAE